MYAPVRAGIFIHAADPDRPSGFYQAVLGMVVAQADSRLGTSLPRPWPRRRLILEENLNDYIGNFSKYMQPEEA